MKVLKNKMVFIVYIYKDQHSKIRKYRSEVFKKLFYHPIFKKGQNQSTANLGDMFGSKIVNLTIWKDDITHIVRV
jgi:hypothetical protein